MMDSHVLWSASPPNLASVLTGTVPLSALCFYGESWSDCPQRTPKQPQNHSVEEGNLAMMDPILNTYILFLSPSLSVPSPLSFVPTCVCVCVFMYV